MKAQQDGRNRDSLLLVLPDGVKERRYEVSNAPADQAVKPAIVLEADTYLSSAESLVMQLALFGAPVSDTMACRPTDASHLESEVIKATLTNEKRMKRSAPSIGKMKTARGEGLLISGAGGLSTGSVGVEVLVNVVGEPVGGVLDGLKSGTGRALENRTERSSQLDCA
jgi:hypothetical protein